MFTTTRTSLACALFMIVRSVLCLVNAEAMDSGNYQFSVRAPGDKKDASAFSQMCPVERSTITTLDMIPCKSFDSNINYCSECYITNPCQNKYFYMTFKTSVVNHLNTTFYVAVSDDEKNSYNNGIWFVMPDGGSYSSYIRFLSNGASSNPTYGINLFSAGPKFPYPTDGTSFIMYDQTGIYYGVNGVIGVQSTDTARIQNVFNSNKLYIKAGSYSVMIATLSDIQVKCLSTDKCIPYTPIKCGNVPVVTTTSTVQVTSTVDQPCTSSSLFVTTSTVKQTSTLSVTTTSTKTTTGFSTTTQTTTSTLNTVSTTTLYSTIEV
ncbi:hypothetical protein BB560_005102 [Smittium megazygosporum]|uniref:Uncharacterized protein n=1 Tax=Smittium megazygosporum TaxID=133381 RepID=A0A2T9Z7I9_9FUNG|nr:hypothetical protein BB560_005102 [Smittium megazygosporum]